MIVVYYVEKIKRLNKKKQIEFNWKNSKNKNRNFNQISKFSISTYKGYRLSDQTMYDIDIFDLFCNLDFTVTAIGEQYLYYILTNPTIDISELDNRYKLNNEFKLNENLRLKILNSLYDFNKTGSNLIVDVINNGPSLFYNKIFQLLSLLALLGIPAIIYSRSLSIFFLFLFGVNLILHLVYRHKNSIYYLQLTQLNKLIEISKLILKNNVVFNIDKPTQSINNLKNLEKTTKYISFLRPNNELTNLIYYIVDLIRAYFLIEPHLFDNANFQISKYKADIVSLYIFIGKIEVSISTAAISINNSNIICTPQFTNINTLQIQSGKHPYIENCIPNDILIYNNNVFLTGSNMSGKSTFLKMVLINSILAQTLNICFAEKYITSINLIRSSIKISDDIFNNISFFNSELFILKNMIDEIDIIPSISKLFIIDEILKGTNNVERISISSSILNHFCNENVIIIASSHDSEIIYHLYERFQFYYFSDELKENVLTFDFKIKNGILSSTNAINLLLLNQFPSNIIENAKSIAFKILN
jgi:DNA mismatch repair ATPase MutS